MMQVLTSYLGDRWQAGDAAGAATLVNPTTEAPVATASTRGLDLGAALAHARTVGGPALRALTFAERGALLAAMSKAIHAERDALIEIGRINAGNTRGDAKFDVDGATGTLMYYAGLARELGERRTLLDGEALTLGRPGTRLQGQHVLLPREGVALHINAFNFPAWGLAEKAACALLAGMPVLAKPATATAWMTWHMVKVVVDAGILPPGALALLTGSVGDLLDHVQPADAIAFTGGAETGFAIRSHPRVLRAGVPVNIEADSLNATVLAPDAEDATVDAFLRHLHKEMTQKAGQKCTGTRRILVPHDLLGEVKEDLSRRLADTLVGDPADDAVHMGPLATAGQQKGAREGLAQLQTQADVVFQGEGPLVGVEPGRGYFQRPVLLQARDPHAPGPVHDVEVFGPVATLLPYDGTVEEAAALVRLGQGSLVGSLYGDDRAFLRDAILALGAHHGRLVVTDAKVADQALHPGLVMPHLTHGGPGRAGGGTELGGPRGLALYQQRVGVQGNGPLIAKLLDA
ncbi:MAG: 3,4-dehydroadipyl-CoA semialdehyde dehydrogenase [Myxococcales bacterium]|nr:3,4-dehydroadipyl-CoA semialdehyde dehydrogenase [Myxococcales bacterium]